MYKTTITTCSSFVPVSANIVDEQRPAAADDAAELHFL